MNAPSDPEPHDDRELIGLLRKEAGFARHLARSLLFDDQLADDVVQQAWLTAIERPPAHRKSVRGWFLTVVRNLALKALRSRQRRSAREKQAARGELIESTAKSVEREHVLRAMTNAVLALDEPYRRTILARFFDDLPPREIAAREGVPVATVQSRITRGLAKLREQLDREHGGESSRLALGLLTFADPMRFAALDAAGEPDAATDAAPDAVLPSPTSSLPSAASWVVPVSVAAVALLTVSIVFFTGDDEPPPLVDEPAPRARAPRDPRLDAIEAELDAGDRDAAGAKAKPGQAPPGLARDATALCVLVCRQSDGGAAPRITVRCIEWSRANASLVAAEHTTDDDGFVWFTSVLPGLATLVLDRGGRAEVTIAPSTWNDAFVWLPIGVDVEGRVRTADGRPGAGTRIWLSGGDDDVAGRVVAVADDAGTFALDDVAVDRTVAALSDRFAPSDVAAIAPTPGAAVSIELVLRDQHARVEGRVRSVDGASIGGAQVEFESLDLRRPTPRGDAQATIPRVPPVTERTAIDGTFRAEPLAPGRYAVRVRAAGYGPWSGETRVDANGTEPLAIELEPGARIEGTVAFADGTPVANVALTALADDLVVGAARSDADGAFALVDLPSGAVTARATSLSGVETASFALRSSEFVRWDPRLARGRVVRGLVRDARTSASAGELVAITATAGSLRTLDVDAAGRFALELRDDASAWLELRDPSSPLPLAQRLVRADDDGVELVVPATAGRITFAAALPHELPTVAIELVPHDAPWRASIVGATMDRNRASIEGVPEGTYRLIATAPRHAPIVVDAIDVRAGATAVLGTLAFEECGELRLEPGSVTADDAHAIDVLDARGGLVFRLTRADLPRRLSLAPGTYRVEHGHGAAQDVAIHAGDRTIVNVD
ncbi:MAG: sigma-70 family RNA polymerase sigma factor [Planctomycetes bacterium]|nr:sigma-70 family RNA polymerase sigma factor [Planctomycetota bacterium]